MLMFPSDFPDIMRRFKVIKGVYYENKNMDFNT